MSYILEALTESERARQQIAAVPKYSLLPVLSEEAQQQRRWPYALAGALLVNAAVLQLWLRPAPPGGVASIKMPTAPQLAQTPAAAAAPDIAPLARNEKPLADVPGITPREAMPPLVQPARIKDSRVAHPHAPAGALPRAASANPVNDGAQIQQPPRFAPSSMAKRNAEAAVATEANPTQTPTIAKRNAGAVVATKANPARIPSPNPSSPTPETRTQAGGATELPPALQQELPDLSVAGFIRDEGSSSMVIVNDRLLREGDEVAPGVKLEKILNDGLEFTYKGYRFKR